MATKTGLLATINGFITAVITQAKHRSSMNAVVDEIYPNQIVDSNFLEDYTTKNSLILVFYNITITKSGNIAHIKGTLSNAGSYYYSNQPIFTWNETEFQPKAGIETYFFAENSTDKVRLKLDSTGLSIFNDAIGIATYQFDFKTYITED